VKPLYITGPAPEEARLRIAAGAARALTRQGVSVMPWRPIVSSDPAKEDTGGRVLAILADACRIFPDSDFALPGDAPPEACHKAELTLAFTAPRDGQPRLAITQDDLGLDLDLPAGGAASLPHLRIDPLLPAYSPKVAALPAYRVGVPRYGVISLPHIAHFSDYALLRAAEWVATPMPGRFDALFFPLTTDPASDREWLALQGLDEWLFTQRAMGCVFYATGTPVAAHTQDLPRETLLSPEALSARLGVRLQPPLPPDEIFDQLADWWDASDAAVPLMEWLASETPRFV
jgi:hypothetical protein